MVRASQRSGARGLDQGQLCGYQECSEVRASDTGTVGAGKIGRAHV